MPKHISPTEDVTSTIADLPATLTIAETAAALRVSRRQVSRWMDSGRLRHHKFDPAKQGRVRISRDAIAEFLRATAA